MFRRHVPPALFLLAMAALIVAIARPVATVTLPTQKQTIVMALDASGSMRAKDIEPSRLVAMQNAAKQFVADARAKTKIGIVTFAATASLVQPPTDDREAISAAIDRIQLQRATATREAGSSVSHRHAVPGRWLRRQHCAVRPRSPAQTRRSAPARPIRRKTSSRWRRAPTATL